MYMCFTRDCELGNVISKRISKGVARFLIDQMPQMNNFAYSNGIFINIFQIEL